MPNYTVCFYTQADWAETTIKARTPKLALATAHQLAEDDLGTLDFQSYDGTNGIEHIIITAPDGETVADWKSGDLHLRLAASDLLESLEAETNAAQAVTDAWEKGDLAGAVRCLSGLIPAARIAIAKAKGGVS